MDSFRFNQQLRHHLDQGARDLSPEVVGALRQRRVLALQRRQIVRPRAEVLVWQGSDWLRRWGAAFLLVMMVAAAASWQERLDDSLEVDAGLLADEVPLNAYLDHSLGSWLEKSSQQ